MSKDTFRGQKPQGFSHQPKRQTHQPQQFTLDQLLAMAPNPGRPLPGGYFRPGEEFAAFLADGSKLFIITTKGRQVPFRQWDSTDNLVDFLAPIFGDSSAGQGGQHEL
ncbi:MAG: hypothetical protein HC812_19690 [Leptolyngbya sp. RL_3_1]|nr:hypothetical protein [Leptolyngbya sp. RL_3_1]